MLFNIYFQEKYWKKKTQIFSLSHSYHRTLVWFKKDLLPLDYGRSKFIIIFWFDSVLTGLYHIFMYFILKIVSNVFHPIFSILLFIRYSGYLSLPSHLCLLYQWSKIFISALKSPINYHCLVVMSHYMISYKTPVLYEIKLIITRSLMTYKMILKNDNNIIQIEVKVSTFSTWQNLSSLH